MNNTQRYFWTKKKSSLDVSCKYAVHKRIYTSSEPSEETRSSNDLIPFVKVLLNVLFDMFRLNKTSEVADISGVSRV